MLRHAKPRKVFEKTRINALLNHKKSGNLGAPEALAGYGEATKLKIRTN
jgi:hypothetical protein